MKQTVLTGLRINSTYHLGNYLGAIRPILNIIEAAREPENNYQVNLFIPDLHSFTTPIDFSTFQELEWTNLRLLVASGFPLDQEGVYLYRQSYLSAHSEMMWILSTFSSFGDLNRMTEFKDKSQKLEAETISAGLFNYPVLMAADILLYDAQWVPVGEDQRQHLEFARRLARRINHRFDQTLLVEPAPIEQQQKFFQRTRAPRIRSLRHPDKKMSKSDQDQGGVIMLSDTPIEVESKLAAATTDNVGVINYDWEQQPGVTNLLTILALLKGQDQDQTNQAWVGQTSYQPLKQATTAAINECLAVIQRKLDTVNDQAIRAHLRASEQHLDQISQAKLRQIQVALGLRPAT